MKILITSDNHLGYKENDDIRGNDSFVSFEEILMLAKDVNADFILQGGDLFHDNRPSRYCIDRTIKLLSSYCLGNNPVDLKSNIDLNYLDKDINISMPIIAIHGNHDDPSGLNNISPLNILHSAKLINYLGKISNFERIDVSPIIIEKDFKLALYALGHIKDRKIYKAFVEGRVSFKKLDDHNEYYNILIVHQNRVARDKDHLPESFIEDFFDLVIYGHEHESLVIKNRFILLQPGSSVRTSLCEGEMYEKYVYILTISESPYINRRKLNTVRNFLMDTIKIVTNDMEKEITEKINDLIMKAQLKLRLVDKKCDVGQIQNVVDNIEKEDYNMDAYNKKIKLSFDDSCMIGLVSNEDTKNSINLIDLSNEQGKCLTRIIESEFNEENDDLGSTKNILHETLHYPLIRLRVESDIINSINVHKFGLGFKHKVANPFEMLKFIRRKQVKNSREKKNVSSKSIPQFLVSFIEDQHLEAIPEFRFIESVEDFVDKDDKDAFNNMIKYNVREVVKKINIKDILIDDLGKEIQKIKDNNNVGNEYIKRKDVSKIIMDRNEEKKMEHTSDDESSYSNSKNKTFNIFTERKNGKMLSKEINGMHDVSREESNNLFKKRSKSIEHEEHIETSVLGTLSSLNENICILEKSPTFSRRIIDKNYKRLQEGYFDGESTCMRNIALEQKEKNPFVENDLISVEFENKKEKHDDSGSDISISDLLFDI